MMSAGQREAVVDRAIEEMDAAQNEGGVHAAYARAGEAARGSNSRKGRLAAARERNLALCTEPRG